MNLSYGTNQTLMQIMKRKLKVVSRQTRFRKHNGLSWLVTRAAPRAELWVWSCLTPFLMIWMWEFNIHYFTVSIPWILKTQPFSTTPQSFSVGNIFSNKIFIMYSEFLYSNVVMLFMLHDQFSYDQILDLYISILNFLLFKLINSNLYLQMQCYLLILALKISTFSYDNVQLLTGQRIVRINSIARGLLKIIKEIRQLSEE